MQTTITEIAVKLVELFNGIASINVVYDRIPSEADVGKALYNCASISYNGFVASDNYLDHKFICNVYFEAAQVKAQATEVLIRTKIQDVLDAFNADKTLGGVVVNAYPMNGQPEFVIPEKNRSGKMVAIVMMLNVVTRIVRR